MTSVFDASVAIKCYVNEAGSDEARAAAAGPDPLVAPDFILVEACNAAWKMVRKGEITVGHAERMLRAMPALFGRLVPAADIAPRALEIAQQLDHPAYDCMYLALAEAEDAVLVSADTRFLRRVRQTEWEVRVRPLQTWPKD